MWGWIALISYLVGWGVMFRNVYLDLRDDTQRWWEGLRYEQKYSTQIHEDKQIKDLLLAISLAVLCPLWILFRVVRFILFPRGIRTQFDREKEAEQRLAEERKQFEEAKKLLKEAGINYVYEPTRDDY